MVVVDKLGVAKRQLETALELFFRDGDPVSIHTLVDAAHTVIRDVNKHRAGKPVMTAKADHELINAPANFFKHARTDPEHFMRFQPQVTMLWIVDAGRTYEELTREEVALFAAFMKWFVLAFPECFKKRPQVDPELRRLFSNGDKKRFLEFALGGSKMV